MAPSVDMDLITKYMDSRGYPPSTYRRTRWLLVAFHRDHPDLGKVKGRHIEAWCTRPEHSAGYRRARLVNLRLFFSWLVLHEHIERDPTLGMRAKKPKASLVRALTPAQAEAVVKAADEHPDVRLRLAVHLMLQCGLRCVEVARAQWGDWDRRNETLEVRGKGYRGECSRRVPLSSVAQVELERYSVVHQPIPGPLLSKVDDRFAPLASETVSGYVGKLMREAGVQESAHALRHTAIEDMVLGGADLRAVQKIAGHASVQVTEIYLRREVHGLREAVEGRQYRAA